MTENQQLRPDLEKFLRDNNIKPGWKDLISSDKFLPEYLETALEFPKDDDNYRNIVPGRNQYLRAFSFAEPGDIKVVIIGTSPAVAPGVANGLAFSTDNYPSASPAVNNFNKAARQATIRNVEDHEIWGENGVLLLNAALTMSGGIEHAHMIENHNDRWFKFLKRLLSKWLDKHERNHVKPLYVITLGYATEYRRNYANHLWHEIYHSNHLNRGNIIEMGIHHPTFPSDSELFIPQMTFCFQEILKSYKYIFGNDFDKRIEELKIDIDH